MNKFFKIIATTVLGFSLIACGGDDDDDGLGNVVQVASSNSDFSTLVTALEVTGLDLTLSNASGVTVLAPTNAAFAKLGEDTLNTLLADPDALANILRYHVIGSELNAVAVAQASGTLVATLNTQSVAVSQNSEGLFVNTSLVTTADIAAFNGVIHAIDTVIIPPSMEETDAPTLNIIETAQANGGFTTLLAALDVANLTSALEADGEFTVFAPTDAAFEMVGEKLLNAILEDADALTAILQQHVVGASVDSLTALTLNGSQAVTLGNAEIDVLIETREDARVLTFGGATVIQKDIQTTNGIIHVIDAVVVGVVALPAPQMTITDIVKSQPENFSTLLAALEATDLDMALDALDGSFTVFAPTNAAFDALGQDAIMGLLNDPDTLSNILLYHVLDGQVLAAGAVGVAQSDMQMVETLNTDNITLSLSGETLYVNLSQVTATNIMAQNGVVHVIDAVLTPPTERGMPTDTIGETAVAAGFNTLVSLLEAANINIDDVATQNNNAITVFAPTDTAFAKLPQATLDALANDIDLLTAVLTQHVIGLEVDA